MSVDLSRVALLMVMLALAFSPLDAGTEESAAAIEPAATFDVEVKYVDGRTEAVTDVWETYKRGSVRELCYISGKERPHIHYSEISTIDFSECSNERNKSEITVALTDGSVRKGLLWDNDSFFGTDKDGVEWRGRIVSLRKLTFLRADSKNSDDREN